jgi:cell division protein FtsL
MNIGLKKILPTWVIPVLVVMAVLTVWVRLSIIKTTYAIGEAGHEIRALEQAKEQMDLRLTGLRSPRRLEGIARVKFGLTQPRADQVIHIKDAGP